ncbi:MAG: hypothetical protein V4671_21980 [Armatimonadota bacterium]
MPESPDSSRSVRILLIEDNFDRFTNALLETLKRNGFLVEVVSDTEQALSQMQAQYGRPDVLIISNKTRGHPESEFLALLRRDPRLSDLPVIVLHKNHSVEDKTRGNPLQEGVQVLKPFNPQEALSVVNRILGRPRHNPTE